MARKTGAPELDEIEITPEMIRAGLVEMYAFGSWEHLDQEDQERTLIGVYRKMHSLMHTSPKPS